MTVIPDICIPNRPSDGTPPGTSLPRNKLFLVLGFTLVFVGFAPAQNYLAAIFHTQNAEQLSRFSLTLLYAAFGLSGLVSSHVCRRFKLKHVILVSSLSYPLFVFAVIFRIDAVLYAASILLGIGGTVLWTAQGDYLTRITGYETRNFYAGIFLAVMGIGEAFSNAGAGFAIEHFTDRTVYLALGLFALLGCLVLSKITEPPHAITQSKKTHFINVLRDRSMILFLPFAVASFVQSGLLMYMIPIKIADLFGLPMVGKMLGLATFVVIIVHWSTGYLADRVGIYFCTQLSIGGGLLGILLVLTSNSIFFYGLGVVLMFAGPAVFYTIAYQMTAHLFHNDVDAATAIRLLVFGIVITLTILFPAVVSYEAMLLASAAICILAVVFNRRLSAECTKTPG